ncbi:MAG: hypothetical protein D6732_10295 [Methanobacteriota archaeon]|nr:MAG: hypothetical protein D6732_10295 [Euryarchaeota archaeon]
MKKTIPIVAYLFLAPLFFLLTGIWANAFQAFASGVAENGWQIHLWRIPDGTISNLEDNTQELVAVSITFLLIAVFTFVGLVIKDGLTLNENGDDLGLLN